MVFSKWILQQYSHLTYKIKLLSYRTNRVFVLLAPLYISKNKKGLCHLIPGRDLSESSISFLI